MQLVQLEHSMHLVGEVEYVQYKQLCLIQPLLTFPDGSRMCPAMDTSLCAGVWQALGPLMVYTLAHDSTLQQSPKLSSTLHTMGQNSYHIQGLE